MSEQIICRNAALGYEDGIVTEDIDFTVNSGDYLCILGENGSGKSTLIKALLGLKPQISGEIKWCGGFSAKDIGYLPQQTPIQRDFPASVNEIVLSGCLSKMGRRHFYKAAEKKLAAENMAQLGISDLAKRCYRELSGGQQQRVAIARAIVSNPKLILADEPTGNLDSKNGKYVMDILTELNAEGTTIIMVTHSLKDAAFAQRTINLFDGQIVSDVKNEL